MPEKIEVLVGTGGSVPSKWSRWEAETAYNPLRSVSHNGSGYVCKKACTGVDPETDVLAGDGVEGEYWILTAKRGKSAYEIAVENGFEGTEADYYEKLGMVPLQASAAAVNAKVAEDAAKNASASANSANNFSTIAEQFSARAVEAFTGAADANAAAQTAKDDAVNAQSGAETARELAESYTNHPPVPGDNGNWQVWDGEKYVDSGKQAVAKDGDAIIDVDALPETDIDETALYRLTTDNNDLYQYKNGWHRVSGNVDVAYDDLKNKPFGETTEYSDTFVWDGNTEGLQEHLFAPSLYKVSDVIVPADDMAVFFDKGIRLTVATPDGGVITGYISNVNYNPGLTDTIVLSASSDDGLITDVNVCLFYNYDNDNGGMYLGNDSTLGYVSSITFPGFGGFTKTEIKTIDPKFLPNGGVSGQSDWDAAEGESGHVLNRTHHRVVKMEPFEVDILELDAAGAPYYDLSAVLGEEFTIFQIRETPLTQEQLNGAQVYFEEVDYVGYGNVQYDADTSAAASEMAGGTIEWYSYHTDRASVAQDADYGSILVIPEDLEIAGMGIIQKGTYQRSVLLGTSNYLGWTFKNEVISPLEAAYAPQPDVHHFVFTSTNGSQYYDASAVPIEVGTSKTFAVNDRFKNHIKQNKPVQIELNINSYASTAEFLLHFPIRDAVADSFYMEQVVYSCDLGVLFIEFTVAGSSLTIKVDNLADKMGCITSADTVNVAEEGM